MCESVSGLCGALASALPSSAEQDGRNSGTLWRVRKRTQLFKFGVIKLLVTLVGCGSELDGARCGHCEQTPALPAVVAKYLFFSTSYINPFKWRLRCGHSGFNSELFGAFPEALTAVNTELSGRPTFAQALAAASGVLYILAIAHGHYYLLLVQISASSWQYGGESHVYHECSDVEMDS